MENKLQTLVLEERKRLNLSGVKRVDGFSSEKIRLATEKDSVIISGENLKINSFSESTGAFTCEGVIVGINFADKKTGLLKRIFK